MPKVLTGFDNKLVSCWEVTCLKNNKINVFEITELTLQMNSYFNRLYAFSNMPLQRF